MYSGSICALITPFRNNCVDDEAFQAFIEWQIAEGTHGFVVCGTTGESSTLSHTEHKRVVELCTEAVQRRVPVLAGTGSNATEEAITLTRHAKSAGADGALVVTPYYNKPTEQGIFEHFKAIHEATDLPLVLYNIPSRCGVDLSIETLARLAKLSSIVGIKDATKDLARPLTTRMVLGESFCQLSGEDSTVVAFLAQGGQGCISVTANVAPRLCAALHDAWQNHNYEKVFEIRDQLMPLHEALFIESNPGPVKYAVSMLGYCTEQVRLPLISPSRQSKQVILDAMSKARLFSENSTIEDSQI